MHPSKIPMGQAKVLLSLENISVMRGMNIVLEEFSLRVHSGEIVALNGENGCGKSTVIECAAGVLALRQGSVKHRSGGELLTICDHSGIRKTANPFGLCLQRDSTTGEETIIEHLQFAAKLAGKEIASEELLNLLASWGLKHRALDRTATLSAGLSRRVSILASLIPAMVSNEPRLILLDEADEGLDEHSRSALIIHLKSLASAGHGILLASHDKELFPHADRTILWHGSKTIESGEIPLTNTSTEASIKSQDFNPSKVYREWINLQDTRTKSTIMSGGIAAILTILTVVALDPQIIAGNRGWRLWTGLVLLPSLVIGLVPGPAQSLLERNAVGSWWAAQTAGRAPNSISIQLPVLAIISTGLAAVMIQGEGLPEISTMHLAQLVLCGLLISVLVSRVNLALWVVHRWLPRPRQGAQMLLAFLIFPWLLAVEGMTILATQGTSSEVWTMLAGSFGLFISLILILLLLQRT